MKKLILILSVFVIFTALITADVYIKTKTHTDAFEMMGKKQPAKDQVSEQWLGKNKFATITGIQNMVFDIGKSVMYIIYPKTKTYVEAQLPLDMSKLLPEQMAQMMSMIKVTVKVSPTSQTKTIGKWKCNQYDVVMNIQAMMSMTMNMKIWATTDVPFDWKTYMDKMFPNLMKLQSANMPFGEDMLNEFKKIKGYQVASELTMSIMGANMRVTTEVVEISKKSAPSGIYSVPAGYKKQDKLTIKQGGF
jgi:hypothetical protein